nr:syndetin-like isoform X1 [Tanacetum cinerariifolium]
MKDANTCFKSDQILISQLKNVDVHARVKASIGLDSMKLAPKNIANVLPNLIRSIKFFPSTDMRMVVVGNNWGTIGFWNVDSEKEDGDGMYTYHTNPGLVSAILIQPFSTNKITTSCYGGPTIQLLLCLNNLVMAIWGWDDSYIFVGNKYKGVDVISAYTKTLVTTLKSPHLSSVPCRFDAHPFIPGMLAGATGGGQLPSIQVMGEDWQEVPSRNHRRSNADDVSKVAKSVFVTNFPEFVSARDLWKSCSVYETVIDVFIPSKKSKAVSGSSGKWKIGCHEGWVTGQMGKYKAIWGWDDSYTFVGNKYKGVDVISAYTKTLVTTLKSPHLSSVPCRFDAHPFIPGMLAGATGGGQVGEKFLSSVRSVGFRPLANDRPEIPARAATAATIARALASIPQHHRQSLSSSSEELSSIYGNTSRGQVIEELEEEFYEEMFDPVRHTLENLPSEENELPYFEGKAALRLLQLDKVTETLSGQVMEHHEVMVKGMHLVKELEKEVKVANVICMNGRRHLTSSRNEVSRDLIVNRNSRRKQALLDILPVLAELCHAQDMQVALETHVNEGNFFKAFQVLPEYLQLLDGFSELLVIQEMSRSVEIWLGKALQKLDSILLGVCKDFKEASFLTVVDAYALIGDVSGLAEKIQSFFMQEVISETHNVLKTIVLKDLEAAEVENTRLTYSDLCSRVPESKFGECLLATLAVIFNLMCSYHAIMNFNFDHKVSLRHSSPAMQEECEDTISSKNVQHADSSQYGSDRTADNLSLFEPIGQGPNLALADEPTTSVTSLPHDPSGSESRDNGSGALSSGSSWFQLRSDATIFVSQTLQRGRRNLWQLTSSRLSVLLSSDAVGSTSIHQFLKNYEDLNTFILAGEAFCGAEAVEFRLRVKTICESYFASFHRQNVYALKMVLEKESWFTIPPETIQVVNFAGLVGDGAALIIQSTSRELQSQKSIPDLVKINHNPRQSGFSHWISNGNPFCPKNASKEYDGSSSHATSAFSEEPNEKFNESSHKNKISLHSDSNHSNGHTDPEDENEDLHADFIDEDSQLPSRIPKPNRSKNHSSHWNTDEIEAHTGSSICVLRLMDKYARLMQRLDIMNIEFFKGICQFFGIFFYYVFESFGQQNTNPAGKGLNDALVYQLKTALSRIRQDCGQWVKSPSPSLSSTSSTHLNMPLSHSDNGPNGKSNSHVSHATITSFGLKERCAGADTISLVARLMQNSKAHIHSILLQNNSASVEDFYVHLVGSVPDLVEQIHRTTARLLLHISVYADRIANAKWEVKELGMEHNGYVDLLLGEFKHYKTRLAHGGIRKEVQDTLIGYGLENLSETVIEGLSRVKRCTDEGRALMSLDFQVLITGLQHFLPINVKPKLQRVETFIKAFYLPETEYVHWARAHPDYTKSQMTGLINLVATMKGWKRKTKLEVLEKIELTSAF